MTRIGMSGAAGQARGEQGSGEINAALAGGGYAADAIRVGDLDRGAYRMFAGHRLGSNWAVEIGYADLGDVSTVASATIPAGEAEVYARALLATLPVAPSGYEASLSYRYAINDAITASVRAGAWSWENDQRANFGDPHLNAFAEGTDILFGLGADWSFGSHWAAGLGASRYRSNVAT